MSWRASSPVAVLVMLLLATGCRSAPDPSPAPSATSASAAAALCTPAVAPGEQLVAAHDTTVGEIRSRKVGPGVAHAPSFAPEQDESDAAAWCWIDVADGSSRRVVARSTSGEQITFVTGNATALSPDPEGPSVP